MKVHSTEIFVLIYYYFIYKTQQVNTSAKNLKKVVNKPSSAPPKGLAPAPPKTSQSNNRNATHPSNIEQNRSITIDRCRTDVSSIFFFSSNLRVCSQTIFLLFNCFETH